jgi:hypothetical protein
MDASRLTITFAILLIGLGLGRFVVSSVGRAGDVMAALFVPPDQALGWPRGVQESDAPWGWRGATSPDRQRPIDRIDDDDHGSTELREWRDPPAGSFVIPVRRVAPVRFGVRPH